jgi:hypothetical protein
MFGILAGIIVFIVAFFIVRRDQYTDFIFVVLFSAALAGLATVVTLPLTGGLMPNYSQGERNGYVTKLSYRGLIFKTWDGELQVGSGNQAALQEPFKFSVPDEKVREIMYEAADEGYRVKLLYNQYLLPDLRAGAHNSIITDIVILDDNQ